MNTARLKAWVVPGLALVQVVCSPALAVDKAAPLSTFGKLPIKELTVFKDGHALVAHEGDMPTDEYGNVLMDYLPAPVLGTFWPYAAQPGARLTSVVASQRRVLVERTALNLRELLEANVGAEVIITEAGTNSYEATIAGLPTRSAEEQAGVNPPNSGEHLPEKGNLILLRTEQGLKALPVERIQEVTFKGAHQPAATNEEFRNLLKLKLDWGRAKPERSAKVGLFYVQKGVRWIPSYKIQMSEDGQASVKLQGTLLNELADLEDVSVNLVVGVPTFAFKESLDPMALQQTLAPLSQYFQADAGRNSPLASQFSNAIMSQQMARMRDYRGTPGPELGSELGPEIGEAGKSEDLFVFTVPHVSLKRGERMVLTVAEFSLPYKDVFTLELPFGPPPEVRANLNDEQQRELARLFSTPKVMHKLRLTNNSKYPLTTAPALIVRSGRVLAQGLMTYTSTGANVDLPITTAVDFQVRRSDVETKRTPGALQENGVSYSRIDLAGTITVASHHQERAELEMTRYVLGTADGADHDGKVAKLNAFDNGEYLAAANYPSWWSWYSWPSWWNYFNGVARLEWKVSLNSKESVELQYKWHYFWR